MNAPASPLASRRRRSITDAAVAGIGSSRGAHISIKGGRFRLINAAGDEAMVPTHYLDVVVVDANGNTSKVFFPEYVPGSEDPPICFSDNGTGPSTQAMEPQSPTCAPCPWNARGSDTTFSGRPTKACQDRKKFAVITPDDPNVTVYEFQVPPGSITNLRACVDWLKQQPAPAELGRKLDLADVVMRIEWDVDKQFTMKFSVVGLADDDRTVQVIDYIDANALADLAVGRNDVAWDPEAMKLRLASVQMPALAPPAQQAPAQQAPAQQAPQQAGFTLPPQAPPQQLAPPPPPQGAPAAPRPRGRPRGQLTSTAGAPAQAAPTAAAPFMAPAAPPAPAPAAAPPQAPALPAAGADLNIPPFLRRAPENAPPSVPDRAGTVAAPPAPPPNVSAALGAAMQLASRR